MSYMVMAYMVMAYMGMAYMAMAHIVLAFIVMACTASYGYSYGYEGTTIKVIAIYGPV